MDQHPAIRPCRLYCPARFAPSNETRGAARVAPLVAPPVPIRGVETPEQQFWQILDLRGLVVYDAGAFNGLLTLLFARQSSQVICYEPNPQNRIRLSENITLKGVENVRVRDVGVGSQPQNLKTPALKYEIRMTALDIELCHAALPRPDFIKIDIEGWEIEALRGGRNTLTTCRPALFLEMHGETVNEKKRKVMEIVA